jgi:hypothetical protein
MVLLKIAFHFRCQAISVDTRVRALKSAEPIAFTFCSEKRPPRSVRIIPLTFLCCNNVLLRCRFFDFAQLCRSIMFSENLQCFSTTCKALIIITIEIDGYMLVAMGRYRWPERMVVVVVVG